MPKISGFPLNNFPDGRSFVVVDGNVSDGKYRAQAGAFNLFPNRLRLYKQENEMDGLTSAPLAPFAVTNATAATGVIASEAQHPGIWRIISGGANTGANITLNYVSAVLIGGGEIGDFIIRLPAGSANMRGKAGFHDNLTVSGAVTDGVLFTIVGLNIYGNNINNGASTLSASPYAASANTWYRLLLIVNDAATRVDYYIYDMAGTQLWTDFLTTNIPTAAGRETGFGIQAWLTVAGASNLLDVDWMAYYNYKDVTR